MTKEPELAEVSDGTGVSVLHDGQCTLGRGPILRLPRRSVVQHRVTQVMARAMSGRVAMC
ncbi:MAG: hypothetical protein AAGA54_13775 [Myxococcota bacterium]